LIKIRLLRFGAALIVLLISTIPSSATAAESFRFGLGDNNQIFTDLNDALTGSSFKLQIKGGVPATIRLDLVDIYADEAGVKQPLPINSSPFSSGGLVEYPAVVGRYLPTNEFQTIQIPFKFKNITNIERPILGGLQISIVADAQTASSINVASSIVATFAYYPIGATTELSNAINPRLDLAKPKFSQSINDLVPFNLIPNLPSFYNQSPLQAELVVKNVGNIFLNAKTKLVVVDSQLFRSGSDLELFSFDSELMLIPNQIGTVNLSLTKLDQLTNDPVDVFPGIGIYRVITTATGYLGETELVTQTNAKWIIIFPWKYVLAALLLLTGLVWQLKNKLPGRHHQNIYGLEKGSIINSDISSFNAEVDRILAQYQESVKNPSK
jgi:hypothetical protein